MKPARKQSKAASTNMQARDLETFRDISDDVIESDFVPYACLYDERTLATKNGELLQIIKITGLGFEAAHQGDLRAAIRDAIRQYIPDTSYAIWLHTLRRRQQLLPHAHFPDQFSGNLDASWRTQHPTSASFVNELYITIVKAGEQAGLRNLQGLIQSLLPNRDALQRTAYLDEALRNLTLTVGQIVERLRPFGARTLSVVDRQGIYYSEQMEFLEKLINLEERPMEVPQRDLSIVLTSGEITFGYNAMEVRTAEGKRRFAAIMSLKEYKESTLKGIDKFLDIPCELIVSQCFDFIGGDSARENYEKQARYLAISGDKEMAQWMEIDRLTQADLNTEKAYGQQQITLFLIAGSVNQLETNVRMVNKALARLGIVAIREDLRFEDCYWSQLPGNFPFIVRQKPTDSNHLAGFANLQNQPMGNASGSSWGAPISLLTTLQDTPYFFNFHRGAAAHTIVLGKPGSGHTTLSHFLVAQARKLDPQIWYLDGSGRAGMFLQAMGGKTLQPGMAGGLRLNPLQLPDAPAHREFLAFWLATLFDPEAKQLNQATLGFFQMLIDAVMKLPLEHRRLSTLLPIVAEQDAMLAVQLKQWCAGGKYGDLFDMPQDQFAPEKLIGWDISAYRHDMAVWNPLSAYLLHRITAALNGNPTLLVLGEGFDILSNPLFALRAGNWFDHLTKQNTACLVHTAAPEASGNYAFTPTLAQKAASLFILPDADPDYSMGYGLDAADLGAITHLDRYKRQVLLKRGAENTVVKIDLSGLGSALTALSGRKAPPMAAGGDKTPEQLLNELMGITPTEVA